MKDTIKDLFGEQVPLNTKGEINRRAAANYRKNHPDRASAAQSKYWKAHKNEQLEKNKQWRRANPARSMFIQVKARAKREKIEFAIRLADITFTDQCPIFGFKFERNKNRPMRSASLDRIDNSKGYIRGNVIVVSKLANTIKSCATPAQVRLVADFYERLIKQQE